MMKKTQVRIYFSEFFNIPQSIVDKYGAFNISLINDLPLFIDPFLLFNSEKREYQILHSSIIKYMRFLKEMTLSGTLTSPTISHLFTFPEVKQNWLGFSRTSNRGHGLGRDFASALHRNFYTIFKNFGEEEVTKGSHIEKLCLVRSGVGRDMISDFTVNLVIDYLAGYSEKFAIKYLGANQVERVPIRKAVFNYISRSWMPKTYSLPYIFGDYVLLMPKDLLTKDITWINRAELIEKFRDIVDSLPNEVLRAQINDYLYRVLPDDSNVSKEKKLEIVTDMIEKYPAVSDYYILQKENDGDAAASISSDKVREVEELFIGNVRKLVEMYLQPGGFYHVKGDSYEEAKSRLLYLKDVIENKGGHKIFYLKGEPIERESDLQILYRLVWFGTPSDVSREVNDGRGAADFKVSRGSGDKTIIEFKLAKNTQLERNLNNQSSVYEKASGATRNTIKAILYFNKDQFDRVMTILKRLKLDDCQDIVLIDAGADNKPSGSKA